MGLFSGIASIFGGGAQKKASRAAEAAQLDYLNRGISTLSQQNERIQGQLEPYTDAGTGALSEILQLLGVSTPGSEGVVDWGAYVQGNPDAAANWAAIRGTSSDKFGGDINAFGKYHYETDGSRRDLTPFTKGGMEAIDGQMAQAQAIAELEASPLFQTLIRNGEEGVLQNASATGGLRGGNTQRSLADFRADTLTQTIENQLSRLGGLAGAGLGAVNSAGQFGANAASGISNIFGQQGQVRSGGILTRGGITAGQMGNIGGILDEVSSGGGILKSAKSVLGGLF